MVHVWPPAHRDLGLSGGDDHFGRGGSEYWVDHRSKPIRLGLSKMQASIYTATQALVRGHENNAGILGIEGD
jgi:hypothetical protein